MNKPVRADDDDRLPLSATLVIGGLAVLGAITLVGWAISIVTGVLKVVVIAVVVLAALAWVGGRRFGD